MTPRKCNNTKAVEMANGGLVTWDCPRMAKPGTYLCGHCKKTVAKISKTGMPPSSGYTYYETGDVDSPVMEM